MAICNWCVHVSWPFPGLTRILSQHTYLEQEILRSMPRHSEFWVLMANVHWPHVGSTWALVEAKHVGPTWQLVASPHGPHQWQPMRDPWECLIGHSWGPWDFSICVIASTSWRVTRNDYPFVVKYQRHRHYSHYSWMSFFTRQQASWQRQWVILIYCKDDCVWRSYGDIRVFAWSDWRLSFKYNRTMRTLLNTKGCY